MALSSSTFISDTVLFIRDFLSSNITDPISGKRVDRERFVMTSYPMRGVKYPIITVKKSSMRDLKRLGFQSEGTWNQINIEVRVWARNEVERDTLTQQVYDKLRTNQTNVNGSIEFELHDFLCTSSVPIDEDDVKSEVMEYQYRVVLI